MRIKYTRKKNQTRLQQKCNLGQKYETVNSKIYVSKRSKPKITYLTVEQTEIQKKLRSIDRKQKTKDTSVKIEYQYQGPTIVLTDISGAHMQKEKLIIS